MAVIPFPPTGERVSRFEEAVEIVKGLLTTDDFSFDGRYYQVRDATMRPRPVQTPYPPISIGANGERMLGIAARHADVWHQFGTPETLAGRSAHLSELASAAAATRTRSCAPAPLPRGRSRRGAAHDRRVARRRLQATCGRLAEQRARPGRGVRRRGAPRLTVSRFRGDSARRPQQLALPSRRGPCSGARCIHDPGPELGWHLGLEQPLEPGVLDDALPEHDLGAPAAAPRGLERGEQLEDGSTALGALDEARRVVACARPRGSRRASRRGARPCPP